ANAAVSRAATAPNTVRVSASIDAAPPVSAATSVRSLRNRRSYSAIGRIESITSPGCRQAGTVATSSAGFPPEQATSKSIRHRHIQSVQEPGKEKRARRSESGEPAFSALRSPLSYLDV